MQFITMKHYNFDEIIDRKGTNCVKYDQLEERFGDGNLIPLWVADMDFRTPDFIVNALRKRDDGKLKKAVLRFFRDTGGETPAEEAVTEE